MGLDVVARPPQAASNASRRPTHLVPLLRPSDAQFAHIGVSTDGASLKPDLGRGIDRSANESSPARQLLLPSSARSVRTGQDVASSAEGPWPEVELGPVGYIAHMQT